MQLSLSFIRILFLGLCILFVTTYATTDAPESSYYTRLVIGIISGLILGAAIVSLDKLFRRFNLRVFNTATIGLFFGYLMGKAILLISQTILDTTATYISPQSLSLLSMVVFLCSCYLGMVMTARASEELYISLPFIKFKSSTQKKKDLIIDGSLLTDTRIIDLASSGLLDHHLVLPRFLVKELYEQAESGDENIRSKARRSLEVIKKLETLPALEMRYAEADFPEIKDSIGKTLRMARLLDAYILTADPTKTQQSVIDGIKIINIHILSTALKPLAQAGEYINIKIQRYGKEPRQGVGYLDDGTMVVVNGGAEYIGDTIRSQVLSVKHTSSGRMIFCNAVDENDVYLEPPVPNLGLPSSDIESTAKNYFAL